MDVRLIEPYGFCFGVRNSYDSTIEIINKHPNSRIFMMGWLVHNRPIINKLLEMNVYILDDKHQSRAEILENIQYQPNDVIIFSAHGTDANVIEKAKQKGFIVYDLTCPFVKKTHNLVLNKIANGYDIVFIGKLNHPETNAILPISTTKIHLVKDVEDAKNLKIMNSQIFCTTQTTLSLYNVEAIYNTLIQEYPQIEFENDICNATTCRQDAIKKIDESFDIRIVVGDVRSSNAVELYDLSKKVNDTYLISYGNEIDFKWFKNKKKCAIFGAASASREMVESIYHYIVDKTEGI